VEQTIPFGPPADPSEVGTLGPYRVLKLLGRGGMGAVYLAVDTRLNRKLALKVMLPQYAADRTARERFIREAQAAAQVSHDNVVTVYEADERDGITYIAMQFLQGYPLDEYLKRKGMPGIPQAVRLVREAAAGLAAAHKIGLVHRDIKPANLWLEAPKGRVKVLDFGLAKPFDTQVEVTKSGVVIGTPAYMSPEQARGQKIDSRTDLFSLGVVLYQLCTGRLPFEGPNIMAVLTALATDTPRPVQELNAEVPGPLADFIHQMLAKDPGQRPATADEVVRRLRTIGEQLAQQSSTSGSQPAAESFLVTAVPQSDPKFNALGLNKLADRQSRGNAKNRRVTKPRVWAIGIAIAVAVVVAGVIINGQMNQPTATNETTAQGENSDDNASREEVSPSPQQEPPQLSLTEMLDQARDHAARREWNEAAKAYADVIDEPVHEWGEMAYEYAAVLLMAGDTAGYKELCAQLVERAGPPGVRPYHAARACVLAADSYSPAERPAEMAQEELDINGTAYWWDSLHGAQRYRAGRYDEALPLFQKSRDDSGQRPDGIVAIQLWMALTYHQMNQPEEARHSFEQAETWLSGFPDGYPPEAERTDLGLHLHNWLEIHVLRQELEMLLDPVP
jgi:serine/threonine protein kinase